MVPPFSSDRRRCSDGPTLFQRQKTLCWWSHPFPATEDVVLMVPPFSSDRRRCSDGPTLFQWQKTLFWWSHPPSFLHIVAFVEIVLIYMKCLPLAVMQATSNHSQCYLMCNIFYVHLFMLLLLHNYVPTFKSTSLKSDSTHHFFRNACTKSGSLRFSQFSGCWLILSVYIIMSFDFPFVRLFWDR